jgi:hypothetical protein
MFIERTKCKNCKGKGCVPPKVKGGTAWTICFPCKGIGHIDKQIKSNMKTITLPEKLAEQIEEALADFGNVVSYEMEAMTDSDAIEEYKRKFDNAQQLRDKLRIAIIGKKK